MKLTRRQRSFFIVCVLCVGALAVDRVFLSPQDASADAPLPTARPAAPVAASPAAPALPIVAREEVRPDRMLAAQFSAIAGEYDLDPTRVRDVFRPPATWLPEAPPEDDPRPDPTNPDERARVDEFVAAHRLTAVMAGTAGRGFAIVDGAGVRVGQELDGFRLEEVRKRSAIFRDGTLEAVLELSE